MLLDSQKEELCLAWDESEDWGIPLGSDCQRRQGGSRGAPVA